MPYSAPSPTIDVYVVHTQMEWQIARSMVELLTAWGYTVGASQRVELPGCVARATPADARATVVIWPLDLGLCDMLKLEARAAAQRGALVQIYAGRVRPDETYPGPPAVDFTAWDYTRPGARWETLIRRLTPLCGPPRSRPLDVNGLTQKTVLIGTLMVTLTAIVTVLGQSGREQVQVAAPDPHLTAPVAPPIVTVADVPEAPVHPGIVLTGGPDEYKTDLGDVDLGVDVAKIPPADQPDADAIAKRAPQGPEQ
jgi:hypothetical protein